MNKKWSVAVDFDGVIHSYVSKFDGQQLDPPVPGAFNALLEYLDRFDVVIYSSRFTPHYPKTGGSTEMLEAERRAENNLVVVRRWFEQYDFPEGALNKLTFWTQAGKPTALIYIDDRGLRFRGSFPSVQEIFQLKPWKVTDG